MLSLHLSSTTCLISHQTCNHSSATAQRYIYFNSFLGNVKRSYIADTGKKACCYGFLCFFMNSQLMSDKTYLHECFLLLLLFIHLFASTGLEINFFIREPAGD